MKFSVGTLVAFAAAALAKPILTNSNYDIVEDEAFTIKWSNAQGPVTITLKTGPSTALKTVTTIVADESSTSFTWTPTDLPSGTYALEITDSSGEPNYSPQFQYVGTGTLPTSSESSASSTVARTSSSAAASTTESSSSNTEESSTSTESSSITSASNSTTISTTPTSTSTRGTSTNTPPANSNNGQRFASSLALVLGTVAALVFFN
jgi:hypothetical protein